uniref:Uncharacterized protein n=1 Tax=Ditylenchus dipsaci TaxID=166011 RepID=A0A915DD36_9BILA
MIINGSLLDSIILSQFHAEHLSYYADVLLFSQAKLLFMPLVRRRNVDTTAKQKNDTLMLEDNSVNGVFHSN